MFRNDSAKNSASKIGRFFAVILYPVYGPLWALWRLGNFCIDDKEARTTSGVIMLVVSAVGLMIYGTIQADIAKENRNTITDRTVINYGTTTDEVKYDSLTAKGQPYDNSSCILKTDKGTISLNADYQEFCKFPVQEGSTVYYIETFHKNNRLASFVCADGGICIQIPHLYFSDELASKLAIKTERYDVSK